MQAANQRTSDVQKNLEASQQRIALLTSENVTLFSVCWLRRMGRGVQEGMAKRKIEQDRKGERERERERAILIN